MRGDAIQEFRIVADHQEREVRNQAESVQTTAESVCPSGSSVLVQHEHVGVREEQMCQCHAHPVSAGEVFNRPGKSRLRKTQAGEDSFGLMFRVDVLMDGIEHGFPTIVSNSWGDSRCAIAGRLRMLPCRETLAQDHPERGSFSRSIRADESTRARGAGGRWPFEQDFRGILFMDGFQAEAWISSTRGLIKRSARSPLRSVSVQGSGGWLSQMTGRGRISRTHHGVLVGQA